MRSLVCAGLALVTACTILPKTPPEALQKLGASPRGYLTGTVGALGAPLVLNREDFVWDLRPSPDAKSVAFSRLGMKSFHLALFSLDDPRKARADVVVNPLEFNVEALDWSPDSALVAAVSRDRSVRLFDGQSGALEAQWLTDEALSTVAFQPSGQLLAVASAKGMVTVLTWPELMFVAETRAHADEVTGLAWASTGELFSSSWDKTVSVWKVEPAAAPVSSTRARFEKTAGLNVFRAIVDGKVSASVVLDARSPLVVMKGAVAQACGIEVQSLQDSTTIPTALGAQVAPVARGHRLTIKSLTLTNLDVAICDACLPPDVQLVLGQPGLAALDVAIDAPAQEYLFTPRSGAAGLAVTSPMELVRARKFTFAGSVNDVTVDAMGAVLGVALSETKAERTREVYEREKRKEVEPERAWDCAARVDARTGEVLEKRQGHRGVVATASISPDGKTLVSGGWDRKVILHRAGEPQVEARYGWAVRRVRFSRDGRFVTVAAWTPQNPLGDHQSDPSAVVYEALYRDAAVAP